MIMTTKTLEERFFAVAGTVLVAALLLLAGCGDASAPPYSGSGGFGSFAGSGGTAGAAGIGGMGGNSGTGGSAGSAGTAGSAGAGGIVGSGGTGGQLGACATNALCHTCPETFLCETDNDCAFSGYVCIASGCETNGGSPIKQCVPSWAASCVDDNDCPNASDYDCTTVGAGGKRCLRVAAGCDPSTETYDCAPGFSCEGGACVDRRVPCDSYLDCPKSHVCLTTPVSAYCVRTHRSCNLDEDCSWLGVSVGQFCANVDGDPSGSKECVGQRGSSGLACVSSDCGGDSVCESGASGAFASCGDYGLCLDDGDCGSGFSCVGLWQDGRKECVQTPLPSSCTKVSDCGPQQVCAAPRTGGPPSCQSGSAP